MLLESESQILVQKNLNEELYIFENCKNLTDFIQINSKESFLVKQTEVLYRINAESRLHGATLVHVGKFSIELNSAEKPFRKLERT